MTTAIIVCGGQGTRMGGTKNKVLRLLHGQPMIVKTVRAFAKSNKIANMVLVVPKAEIATFQTIVRSYKLEKVHSIVAGGKERFDSVCNGLKAVIAEKNDIILVHNGANPLVDQKTIADVIAAAKKHGAALAAFPAVDTIKVVENGFVKKTIPRKKLWQAQTPQAIQYGLFLKAVKKCKKTKLVPTDDVSLVEALGKKVAVVECAKTNFKLTDKADLKTYNKVIDGQLIGIGLDSHRFSKNKKSLWLGGIEVSAEGGFQANSDGDIVLHALFNAIATAIGKKSLGSYADSMCKKGITDSSRYLEPLFKALAVRNLKINNVAIMIEGKTPKIDPISNRMKTRIARICSLKRSQIGIAATTGESLTPWGNGKGAQCMCVVSLSRAP